MNRRREQERPSVELDCEIEDAGHNIYRTKMITTKLTTANYLLSEFIKICNYEGIRYTSQPVSCRRQLLNPVNDS